MGSSNKIPTEQKLAGVITGCISLIFLSILIFYKIVIPVHNEITKPSSGLSEISYISENEALSSSSLIDDKSLSSKLPSGISQSVTKMETEMFTNSFISSFSQSSILKSNYSKEIDAETPGKAPNQSIGKDIKNPDLLKGKSSFGGNLKNRKLLFIEEANGTNEEGCVIIKLIVSPNGKVTNAEIDSDRTTTASTSLRSKALETSLTAIFETSTLEEEQTGFITFKFEY